MKKRNPLKKVSTLILGAAMMLALLAGCTDSSSKTTTATNAGTDASAAGADTTATGSGDKTLVKIGIGNAYAPFCFLDENEKEAGYDYDCMLAVAELLSDKYEFEFTPDAFQNLLIGLDTGAYDIAIHHFGYNEERAANYLYAEEGDMYINYFVVAYPEGMEGVTDLQSCADNGKVVVSTAGSQADNILLEWNASHPDAQIAIEYVDSAAEVMATGLANGLYDAFVVSTYDCQVFNDKYGDTVKLVYSDDEADMIKKDNPGIYFIYAKDQTELQKDVDAALVTLRENGTLSKLSIEWLGDDYSMPIE